MLAVFAAAKSPVVVVAHPDDETLFCAGLILRYPGPWAVIACSIPRRDPIRAYRFFFACEQLGARGVLLPFQEQPPDAPLLELDRLDLYRHDVIVTHNRDGEYGHAHHRQVHRWIVGRWPDRTWTIGWRPGRLGAVTMPLSPAERRVKDLALCCYEDESPGDGAPKWRALLDRYTATPFNLDPWTESYDPPGA